MVTFLLCYFFFFIGEVWDRQFSGDVMCRRRDRSSELWPVQF